MTQAERIEAAIAEERQAMVAYAETYCAAIDRLVARRRVPAGEANMLQRRIRAFASDIEAGVHVVVVADV